MPAKKTLVSYALLCYLLASSYGLTQGLPQQAGLSFDDLLKNMTDQHAKHSGQGPTAPGSPGI